MDLISIIVPVYNVQSYLPMCLESIAGQTYNNLQIILVDDGSPDSCPQICDEWAKKDKRIEVIHKVNGGLSDARNCGLEHVTGEYVCFVDSDDVLDQYYIEWLHDAIIKNGVRISACDIKCFYDGGTFIRENKVNTNLLYSAEEGLRQILHGEGVRAIACNKMYKTKLLIGEQFVYGKHHEDEFFTYRMIDKAEGIAYVDAALYYYRQRSGSIMASFSIKRLDALEAFLERLELLGKKYPMLYKKDKVIFCISCVSYYRCAKKLPDSEKKNIEKKIRQLRKQIKFSFQELFSYSVKEIIYILGSLQPKLICGILDIFRGKCDE